MKKYIFGLCILAVVYIVSNSNFYLGSNSSYYNTPFELSGSKWQCLDYNVKATVPAEDNPSYMILEDLNTDETYMLVKLDNFTVELYTGISDEPWLYKKPLYRKKFLSKKSFGKITKFTIQNINKTYWFKSGQDKMVFELSTQGDGSVVFGSPCLRVRIKGVE